MRHLTNRCQPWNHGRATLFKRISQPPITDSNDSQSLRTDTKRIEGAIASGRKIAARVGGAGVGAKPREARVVALDLAEILGAAARSGHKAPPFNALTG